ncbi:rab11 family-interacting protein 1 isoform X1 [Astyanax mexicanus]|uniref:rab11 family-interacting protein 1 isoform X1 n=1 Tax=Astyanax mexicanus TaxID=7994 RepID=UPI0020CAE8B1|nr:rab11 family-interacting protein 1 isoform X1 [Astyanax mexicanus]
MPLISLDDDEPRWVPTHVNVTVIRARGLRTKGKQGSRYVYTVIQVGKDKYTTGLVEKALEPEWNEECSFELLPGLLEDQGGSVSAYAPGSSSLVLTVMHRVLIGLDVFLGQAVLPLDKAFRDGVCPRNEWLKLHSKVGRKEKERGELMVTVQFTRNNMTASMYDLTVKDKPRSAFGKLKDRVTGKKRADVESSSAILPGRYAALSSSTSQSLQENGGEGVPVVEDCSDERRSKVKDFFLKGKLRKNSDTRSCSSLASESSMASSTGEPFVPIELCSTPIYSSRVMEPFRTDTDGEIKVMTHKRAYSDEASKITAASRPCPAVENLKGQNSVLSKSTLCINGSHVYSSEPACAKSPGGLPVKRTLLEKCSPLSRSLQNITRRSEDPQKADGRRWSIDKGKKEAEAEASTAQTQAATTSEGKPILATAPLVVASGGAEGSDKGKKLRKTLFSSGRSDSLPAKAEQASGPQEGRLRGWFGSGDAQNKPRLGVSPKVESSPDPSCPLSPCFPGPTPDTLPLDTATGQMSPPSVIHHSNPFTHPSPPPTSISPSNPFLTRLQRNPFFEDLIAEEALKSPTEMSSYSSLPHAHYPGFLPRPGRSSPASEGSPSRMSSIKRERPRSVARQRSLPALIPGTEEAAIVNENNINANSSRLVSENKGETDDFEAFATSRLKSPVGTPTRPSSGSFSSSLPSHNPIEQSDFQPNNGTMIDNPNQADWDLPPLPPRKLTRTPFAGERRDRPSDSWLDRGQELAVQKEASVLFQTDLASLQHTRDTNTRVSPVNKESIMYLHCAALEQNLNLCPPSLTPQMPTDGNLNVLKLEDGSFLTEGGIGPNLIRSPASEPVPNAPMFGLAGNDTANSSQNCLYVGVQRSSESDRTVPNTPYCLSDCDTTVSESLCSSFQNFPKPETSCEVNSKPKTTYEQWDENIATSGDITARALPARDSNNNTNDTSQFAFIDSDNSLSDVIQGTFGATNNRQEINKALLQCQNFAAYSPSGNEFSVCRSSPGIPEDLINRMTTELDMFSPKTTLETNDDDKYHTLQQASFFEGPCGSLEGCDMNKTHPKECVKDMKDVFSVLISPQPPLELNLRAESEGSGYKDSFVAPQTASALNNDDGSATAQPKPEAAHHNAGLDTAHEGGGYLSNDELKTGTAEVETEGKNCEVPFSRTGKSCLTNNLSFEEFHAQVAPRISKSPLKAKTEVRSARIRTSSATNSPKMESSTIPFTSSPERNSTKPLHGSASSFSRPPTDTVSDPITALDPVADLDPELTTLSYPTTLRPGLGSPAATAHSFSSTAQPQVAAQHTLFPEEAQPASSLPPPEESSPHPVKPLTNTAAQGEKKSEGRSVLEKIRSSIHPGRSSQQSSAEPDKTQEVYMSEARAHYQTLTNMELIALLLQQEIEAERQREESELQATLLEKREAELKKMKVQVRDLEDYIDKLLVRIMEQTPTLLQVRARPK